MRFNSRKYEPAGDGLLDPNWHIGPLQGEAAAPSNAAPTVTITPRLTPSGGEVLINTTTAGSQIQPAIAPLASGGFVAAWAIADGAARGLKFQLFDAAGARLGGEATIITDAFSQYDQPCISPLPDGGFVICWHGPVDSSGFSPGPFIIGQVYDASGGPVGAMFYTDPSTVTAQFQPSVAALASGGFVVCWTQGQSGSLDVKARIFDGAGAPLGSVFQVGTGSGDQNLPSVTALPSGGFTISWRETAGLNLPGIPTNPGGDGSGAAVKAQVFTATGATIGAEILVNTSTAGDQTLPATSVAFVVMLWTAFDRIEVVVMDPVLA